MCTLLQTATSAVNPIQFLGSKVQLLSEILEIRNAEASVESSVDLFSGTSVVSQALASRGLVTGIDASDASRILFNGMVSNRRDFELVLDPDLLELPEPSPEEKTEQRFLKSGNHSRLIGFYRNQHERFQRTYEPTRSWWEEHTDHGRRWVEAIYGGHFYGFRQGRYLDGLRNWIAANGLEGTPYHAALLGTASRLTASAGKHFASPLNFQGDEVTDFVIQRLTSDRSRGVLDTFHKVLEEIYTAGPVPDADHQFQQQDLSNPNFRSLERPGFVYADPPYTTDQYSRFYHFLDSLARDDFFVLTLRGGVPVKGRYHDSRMVSPFSVEAKAEAAFDRLYEAVSTLDAPFAFSYSSPKKKGSRSRTVTLQGLHELLHQYFREVDDFRILDHRYRPLQPAELMQPSAAEVIVVARH